MGNYDKMSEMASALFLQQDQDALLARYLLRHDSQWIYLTFLSDEYRIDRATGLVYREDCQASPNATLAIMDMVCNCVGAPVTVGEWCTVAQLAGAAASPSTKGLFDAKVAAYAGHADRLRRACERLGARAVPGGEVSYVIDVFDGLPLWLQFWDADDEFPAQMTFLWDKATTLYLHYETLWYILFEVFDHLAQCA